MATYLPSNDGTNQSIAVVPFVSRTFGSSTTFSDLRSSADASVTKSGCCFGGWDFMANKISARETDAEELQDAFAYHSCNCFSIAARSGKLSRFLRVFWFCASDHAFTCESSSDSSH